ncbi:MAG: hypothetical protein IJ467_06470 [Bacteroidaceae bacterium]|nr:hypothetical protein [Bacteroidaceae bacterium]
MTQKLFCIILYFFPMAFCYATESTFVRLSEYVRGVYHFSRLYPQEKVWLHFDNTGYFQGDTIWFKAYVHSTHPERHEPLSRVLYVELVSPIGQVVHARKLKIENGECWGELPLQQVADLNGEVNSFKRTNDVLPGFYEVRAYTRYMLNWDTENIFSRVFPVYDRPSFADGYLPTMVKGTDPLPERRKEPKEPDGVSVYFYPEGGHAVKDVPCRMAYLITNKEGIPLSVPATLTSGNEKPIKIPCLHDGMGVFTYTPTEKKAILTIQHNEKKYSFTLPKAEAEGYAMTVDNRQTDSLYVTVRKNGVTGDRLLGMTIQHEGNVLRFDTLRVRDAATCLNIPTGCFPDGVCQATLFDEWGKVWGSRLFFVRHSKRIPQISFTLDGDTLQQADKNATLQIVAKQRDGTPFQGCLSVSVRDMKYEYATRYCESFLVNRLLGSELKGYIHNPEYYFENNDKKRHQKLDLLMMVQGWRRYDWQKMCRLNEWACPYYIEDGLILSGKVLNRRRQKPVTDRNVRLWMYDDYHNLTDKGNCLTDSMGQYNFRIPDFYGQKEMHLALKDDEKVRNVRFMIDREISPEPRAYRQDEITLPESWTDNAGKHSISEVQELPDVVKSAHHAIKKEGIHMVLDIDKEVNRLLDKGIHVVEVGDFLERMDIGISHGNSALNLSGQTSAVYSLYGRTASLWVKNGKAGVNLPRTQTPLWDEMDIDNVKRVRLYDIKYLRDHPEVLNAIKDPQSRYSRRGYNTLKALKKERIGYDFQCMEGNYEECVWNQAMILIDVKSRQEQHATVKGLRTTYFGGFSQPKTFTADYTHRQPVPGKDFRRTLYWNPTVETNSTGQATVTFRNNSTNHSWRVTVAGQSLEYNTSGWETLVSSDKELPIE